MLKKSVLLVNFLSLGMAFGLGAEAGKKLPVKDLMDGGISRLFQCKGLPQAVRDQMEVERQKQIQKAKEKEDKKKKAQNALYNFELKRGGNQVF